MSKDEINAFLGVGTEYEGKLSFKGTVRIDGIFTGQIITEGTLVVGKDAIVSGEVRVGELMLTGKIIGDIYAERSVMVYKNGQVEGVINSSTLIMEEGARIQGQINMPEQAVSGKK